MSPREGLWDFALRVYGSNGVAEACLTLQDRHGLDVPVLLYCCWVGCIGQELDDAGLARALRCSEPWAEQIVRPLRRVRRWLKESDRLNASSPAAEQESLRSAIKAAELEAERLQLRMLEAMTDPSGAHPLPTADARRVAADNLAVYIGAAGLTIDSELDALLGSIVVAAVATADCSETNAAGSATHRHD